MNLNSDILKYIILSIFISIFMSIYLYIFIYCIYISQIKLFKSINDNID